MTGRWWRAYDEALHDPKLIALPDRLFRAWFNLLCIASKHGGILPAMATVAIELRVSLHKAAEWVTALVLAGLVDEIEPGKFSPHNWDRRQFQSDVTDPTNATRQKRHRERHRVTENTVTSTVTDKRPETEAEEQKTEKKDSEPNGSGADAPVDHRKALFSESLATLARITGKTPNSCRSLVGKWLSSVQDEAIHVRGWIEEAERNAIADPVGWIEKQIHIFRGDRGSVFNAAPRPGSKEDNRERTAIALRKLGDFAARADDAGTGGSPRAPDVGLLPFAKPTRS